LLQQYSIQRSACLDADRLRPEPAGQLFEQQTQIDPVIAVMIASMPSARR
jgi:hypothetical protein